MRPARRAFLAQALRRLASSGSCVTSARSATSHAVGGACRLPRPRTRTAALAQGPAARACLAAPGRRRRPAASTGCRQQAGQLSGSTKSSTSAPGSPGWMSAMRSASAAPWPGPACGPSACTWRLMLDSATWSRSTSTRRPRRSAPAPRRPRTPRRPADHGHAQRAQARVAGIAVQAPQAAEAALEVGCGNSVTPPLQRHTCSAAPAWRRPRCRHGQQAAQASVDRPDSPWPTVQPMAVTPPTPISTAPTRWLAVSSVCRQSLPSGTRRATGPRRH
jgi:hypothetical protein